MKQVLRFCLIVLFLLSTTYLFADEPDEDEHQEMEMEVDEEEEHDELEDDHDHEEGEEEDQEHEEGEEEDHQEGETAQGGDAHDAHAHGKDNFTEYGLVKFEPGYKEFNIKLDRFKYSPEVIRVDKGDRVKLNLDSVDVEHGFYLDGYGIDVIIPEKGFKSIEFVADKSGAFRFRCSSTCGPFHPFMIGKLSVGPNYFFWGSLAGVMVFPIGALTVLTLRRKK